MSEEVRASSRNAFFTTRSSRGATGLGLYIADRVVQWASGKLNVDSSPGKGTTATIRLPVWAD